MSEEQNNLTGSVMEKIRHDGVKMRPKAYFVLGSLLTFVGLVASAVVSVFLVGLVRFSLRSHGPMGEYRLERILASFPWWTVAVALLGLIIGIVLLRRYDFSYKKNFKAIVIGFVLAVILAGWIVDMMGINDALSRRGPMQGVMRQYWKEQGIQPPGAGRGGWRYQERMNEELR